MFQLIQCSPFSILYRIELAVTSICKSADPGNCFEVVSRLRTAPGGRFHRLPLCVLSPFSLLSPLKRKSFSAPQPRRFAILLLFSILTRIEPPAGPPPHTTSLQNRRNSQLTHGRRDRGGPGIASRSTISRIAVATSRTPLRSRSVSGTSSTFRVTRE